MTLVAFILDPDVITRILEHLDEPTRPPEPAPARSPPQLGFEWEVDADEGAENVDDVGRRRPDLLALRFGDGEEHAVRETPGTEVEECAC